MMKRELTLLTSSDIHDSFSTLLLNFCNKKQETEGYCFKLCGYIYHQGTYTPQAGSEKAGFLPFIGVRKYAMD